MIEKIPRYVYFIKPVNLPGPIKIGNSDAPLRRLEHLMAWSPFDLELLVTVPGPMKLERNIHECFAEFHLRHEWFEPAPALLAGIAALKRGEPVEQAFDLTKRTGTIRAPRQVGWTWSEAARRGASESQKLRWARRRAAPSEHSEAAA